MRVRCAGQQKAAIEKLRSMVGPPPLAVVCTITFEGSAGLIETTAPEPTWVNVTSSAPAHPPPPSRAQRTLGQLDLEPRDTEGRMMEVLLGRRVPTDRAALRGRKNTTLPRRAPWRCQLTA